MNTQGNLVSAEKAFAEKSERDLINAVQAGDKKAYQKLYQTYIGQVYGLCFRLTSDRSLAEDASQEVFIQLEEIFGNAQQYILTLDDENAETP